MKMNYLSGSNNKLQTTPMKVASITNSTVLNNQGEYIGVVMMDYPTSDLIEHIIKQN